MIESSLRLIWDPNEELKLLYSLQFFLLNNVNIVNPVRVRLNVYKAFKSGAATAF